MNERSELIKAREIVINSIKRRVHRMADNSYLILQSDITILKQEIEKLENYLSVEVEEASQGYIHMESIVFKNIASCGHIFEAEYLGCRLQLGSNNKILQIIDSDGLCETWSVKPDGTLIYRGGENVTDYWKDENYQVVERAIRNLTIIIFWPNT